ncbi:MAG: chromate resistance protein ChrB domain-containing protein [Candidatus Bathyarchaeia archaeon]
MDRTTCPWLIKNFVDPKAEFIFVPIKKVEEVAKKRRQPLMMHRTRAADSESKACQTGNETRILP